jgi:hypothetical protein
VGKYLKLLGFALLAVILWQADLPSVARSLAGCRPGLALAGFGLGLLAIAVKALRWHGMLRRQGHALPFWRSIRFYFAGIYIGVATPGRLGELARVLYLKRDLGVSAGAGLSSIILDRVFDLYALLAAGLAAVWILDLAGRLSPFFAAGAIAVALLPVLTVHPRIGRRVAALLLRLISRTSLGRMLADSADDFYDGIHHLLGPRLLLDGLLTLAAYAVLFAGAALLAASLGIDVTPLEAGLLLGLANLVALVPVTVAGVGTRDAVFVLAFPALGLPESQALAFSALVLAVFFLGAGLTGFAFFAADRPPAAKRPATQRGG